MKKVFVGLTAIVAAVVGSAFTPTGNALSPVYFKLNPTSGVALTDQAPTIAKPPCGGHSSTFCVRQYTHVTVSGQSPNTVYTPGTPIPGTTSYKLP